MTHHTPRHTNVLLSRPLGMHVAIAGIDMHVAIAAIDPFQGHGRLTLAEAAEVADLVTGGDDAAAQHDFDIYWPGFDTWLCRECPQA
jgi:hypothetical protein